jgi:hypothetical protein
MKLNQRFQIYTLVSFCLFSLSSCLELKVEKMGDALLADYSSLLDVGGASGRAVFDSQVSPLLASARCVSCHSVTSPQFGQSDKTAAYLAAKSALNLNIPAQSRLIFKAGDGHCAPTCSILGSGVWSPAVIAWADAEKVQNSSGGASNGAPVLLTSVTTLDSTRVNAVMTYPLAARGSDFTNVSFEMTLTDPALNTQNLAVIASLKLINNSNKSILVEGVQIFQSVDAVVSGTDPLDFNPVTGNDFANISVVVPPMSTRSLSVASSVIDKEESGGYIAFGFQKLQVSP